MTSVPQQRIDRAAPFVKSLEAHFGRHPNPSVFYTDIAREIGGFTQDVIEAAARSITIHRKYRDWPTLAECLAAVRAARQDILSRANPKPLGPLDGYKMREDEAKRLLLCEMGYMAALEGYHVDLYDYARRHGKLPNQRELTIILDDLQSPTFTFKGKEIDRRKFWEPRQNEPRFLTIARQGMLARHQSLKEWIMENYQPRVAAE